MAKFGVGQPVRRVEDQRFLTGQGRYVDDIALREISSISTSPVFQGLSRHAHQTFFRYHVRVAPRPLARWLPAATGPRFYRDDPIARVPESQDASHAAVNDDRRPVRDDLQPLRPARLQALRPRGRRTSTRSTKCPTRAGSPTASAPGRSPSTSSSRGPIVGAPPDPSRWTIIREKSAGVHPGVTARDAQGRDVVPRVRSAVTTPTGRPPPS